MTPNYYWPVYQNIEREILNLSWLIHFDDSQLDVYSSKISELLIRTAIEIESISKELYFQNGGKNPSDRDLYFDTDCLAYLNDIWKLSEKKVTISATIFYFEIVTNKELFPLKNAQKRGSSSSRWKKAYQSIKHNRVSNISLGSLRNLISASAALYLLNTYYKNNSFVYSDSTLRNFDYGDGSDMFSIKVHLDTGVVVDRDFIKQTDFNECVYLCQPTLNYRKSAQSALKIFNAKYAQIYNENIEKDLEDRIRSKTFSSDEEFKKNVFNIKCELNKKYFKLMTYEDHKELESKLKGKEYEVVLNKQQY